MTAGSAWRAPADRIAAHGLVGAPAEPITISENDWPRFNTRVSLQRLTGLSLAATEAGRLRLARRHEDELRRRQSSAMLHALALERRLLDIADVFDAAGIDFVVLKGPAIAHAIYPDPAWRPFLDIDLLVRGARWRAACAALADAGFFRVLPEPRPGFDERFGKAALHRDEAGLQLDLHRRLVLGPFGLWIDGDELFEHTDTFLIGGRRLRRLDDTALLLHACVHAVLGSDPPRRLSLRDVAEVAQRGRIDLARLVDLGSRWRLGAVMSQCAGIVESDLGVTVREVAETAASIGTTRRELRSLSSYTRSRRKRGGVAVGTLHAIPSMQGKVAYALALLVPNRQFLSVRAGDSRRSYMRRWLIPLRWVGKTRANG